MSKNDTKPILLTPLKTIDKEELIQKVLTSKEVELESIYPASALYIPPERRMIPLSGYVINEKYLVDEYSGEIFSVDDPYLTDLENMDEFDF